MKLAVPSAPQRIDLADEPVRDPVAGEVLLRVAACGVCASELDVWEGRAGVGYAGDDYACADDVKSTFMKDGGRDERESIVIGE